MLSWKAEIDGYAIHASDGLIGTISDFLFDDHTWSVRWFVIDAGDWLHQRKVLLPPSALEDVDHIGRRFDVKLTRKQVQDSPGADTERPVSRQQETKIYDYYSWSPYWGNGSYMDVMGYGGFLGGSLAPAPTAESIQRENEIDDAQRAKNDPTLRSGKVVAGYHICANDGEIGHVEDFLIGDDWRVHYLAVDTKNWWPGDRVLIAPLSVQAIQWTERLVCLNVDRQTVKASPAYDPTRRANIYKGSNDMGLPRSP